MKDRTIVMTQLLAATISYHGMIPTKGTIMQNVEALTDHIMEANKEGCKENE